MNGTEYSSDLLQEVWHKGVRVGVLIGCVSTLVLLALGGWI